MAIKTTGISRDLIIHPGETIADILEARNITQAELAARTGVSATYVGNIISGKKDISRLFAGRLEYALEIPKSFWLNLQARYDAEMLDANEENTINNAELDTCRSLHEVVTCLRKMKLLPPKANTADLVLSLRRLFKVSNLCNLEKIAMTGAFRIGQTETITPCILGAWIRMCQINECTFEDDTSFNPNEIDSVVEELKCAMLSDKADIHKSIKSIFRKYGLDFEIVRHFRGAPVQGFIYKRADNCVKICMTIRHSFADIFWFSLFHELGHLYNGDLLRASQFIDSGLDDGKEKAADRFAADRLLERSAYEKFIVEYERNPSYELIESFAAQQRVKPFIVVGRMQKEKIIGYQQYSFAKVRYKWDE